MDELDAFSDDEEIQGTTFRDVITLCLMGFAAVIIFLLPHINPPGEDEQEDVEAQGMLMVELTWPEDNNCDIDLWVQAPGDVPVGFTNKTGQVFALLRDVLKDPPHQELSVAREIPSGEYIINAHSFRCDVSMPVSVLITRTKNDTTKELLETDATVNPKEELTLFRFTLDNDGNIVPGSVHHLQKDLFGNR